MPATCFYPFLGILNSAFFYLKKPFLLYLYRWLYLETYFYNTPDVAATFRLRMKNKRRNTKPGSSPEIESSAVVGVAVGVVKDITL